MLLQTLAIKCITVLKNDEVVEDKLQQRSELGRKSDAMDGILGPNTFYVLASIAKDQGLAFNGVVDQKLIDTMVDICRTNETIPEEVQEVEEQPEENQEEIEEAEMTEQSEEILQDGEAQEPPQQEQENTPETQQNENTDTEEEIVDTQETNEQTSNQTNNENEQGNPRKQDVPEETNTNPETNDEPLSILDQDFKEKLDQDFDINTKITNIDKLISEYPDIAKLIESMKNIGIDYQQAKTTSNERDINRVIAILNEIEYRNVADMQKIVDMTRDMKLSGEQAVRCIIFYKAFERKEIINPDLTSIDTLRNSYEYTNTNDLLEKAAYEEKLLELYRTKTDEKDKRTIMKEYTRTLLQRNFSENNIIRTDNQGKIYNVDGIGIGVYYNQQRNELFINYTNADPLPRNNEYQTVIFSKEDFLSKPAIVAPEIAEAPKLLSDYPEFEKMNADLDDVLAEIKDPFELYLIAHGFDKNNLRTEENTTETKLSKKFLYEDKEIVEIGIEIHEKKPQYFITYINQEQEKTQRSDANIS